MNALELFTHFDVHPSNLKTAYGPQYWVIQELPPKTPSAVFFRGFGETQRTFRDSYIRYPKEFRKAPMVFHPLASMDTDETLAVRFLNEYAERWAMRTISLTERDRIVPKKQVVQMGNLLAFASKPGKGAGLFLTTTVRDGQERLVSFALFPDLLCMFHVQANRYERDLGL